ncbi:MAG TPA: lipoate--protein ligase family protein [Chloroflexia bacterium]|nr:lipoate--protein ligase family protein [Chloroflexia bacterium]
MLENAFPPEWRLLRSGRNRGAYNMAHDEALWQIYADKLAAGEAPAPVLRLYGWEPAALSLGYAQRAEREVNFEACARLGVDWVRRPTGGRAILHDEMELTYGLIAACDDPRFNGGVLESYRKISGALLEGLNRLGVQAELAGKDKRGEDGALTAACFDAPSAYEITWQGRKIIGSAQARRGNVLLQQGTILLAVDVEKLFTVLNPPARGTLEEAIAQVSSRLTSIEEARGQSVSFLEAEEAFAAGFAAHFGNLLQESQPDTVEIELTHQLMQAKYDNPAWNMERQRPAPAFR